MQRLVDTRLGLGLLGVRSDRYKVGNRIDGVGSGRYNVKTRKYKVGTRTALSKVW